MAIHLFVYGTLKKNYYNKMARFLRAQSNYCGNAIMNGRLYDLGSYPGFVFSEEKSQGVQGEVYLLHHPALVFTTLDKYEGDEYVRKQGTALQDGQPLDCWVYEYVGAIRDHPIISGGSY